MNAAEWIQIPRRHSPATIVELKVSVGDQVKKQTPLLIYEFKERYKPPKDAEDDLEILNALHKKVDSDGLIRKREFLSSPFEGQVTELPVKTGDFVETGVPLIQITIPCSHDAVFNGLCGLCGKDVSKIDHTGIPDSRANIDMFHDANGLKVSYSMAANLDAETRTRLWNQKKLSLVIDLDQTIIHADATFDPHFQAKLLEAYKGPQDQAQEQTQAQGRDGSASDQPGTPPTGLPRDIGTFYLPDSPQQYFVKMRPGLPEFLEELSKLYEMHIYTMGTRPYANAVAQLIDPEHRFFNGRILSRDESGSMTEKSLKRLFPVDTSMAVIMDDRSDVWDWSPNLIRVYAYEFFRGVGDINAGFLPPKQINESREEKDEEPDTVAGSESGTATAAEETSSQEQQQQQQQQHPVGIADSTGNHPTAFSDLVASEDAEPSTESAATTEPSTAAASSPAEQPKQRRKQLVDSDRELYTLREVLTELHKAYYDQLGPSREPPYPDIAHLLSDLKRPILKGVTIVFTAAFPVIPGSPPPHKTDLWQCATSFGAKCELEISPRTTHVVAGKPGTEKVHMARSMRSKKTAAGARCPPIVVKTSWLFHSLFRWERPDETAFLWYPEDADIVKRFHEEQKQLEGTGDLQLRKRRSGSESESRERGKRQSRGEVSAIQRLRQQAERDANGTGYDSANTTDIEAELERQEEGLQEHEAEVNTFVQGLDWDDLERELMGDTDSEDASGASRPQTPEGSNGARHVRSQSRSQAQSQSQSRNGSTADLRQVALEHATGRRIKTVRFGKDGVATDSSDVYGESSSGSSSDDDKQDDGSGSGKRHRDGHRMKRRKTAVESRDPGQSSRRHSKLSVTDGSVDFGTNTDDSEDDADQADSAGDHHRRRRRRRQPGGSGGDVSDDDYYKKDGRNIDAPLFAGIPDDNAFFETEHSDDSEFENVRDGDDGDDEANAAGKPAELGSDDGGYSSDSEGGKQWGEDDVSDEENFDDLINDLEEEISSQ
ncbi:CTD phosphatase Fcp1 [Coemansia sp. RSA 2599]|nr:CTD phosphatase Fcp1 [Coemansia sp. RSA 2599]